RLAHDTFLNNKINATSHSIYKDVSRTRNQLGFETETIKEAMKIGLNNLYKEKNSKSIYKFLDHKVSADIKRFKKFRRDNNVESIKAILFHLNAQSYNQDLRKQCKMDISADILFSILHLLKTNDVPDTHIDLLLIKLSTNIRPHFFNSEKSISLIFYLIELMTFLSKQENKPCTTRNKAYSYLIKSFTGEHSLKTTSLSFGYAYAVILENLMGYKDVTKKYLLDNCVDDNIYITMAHLENIVSMFNFKTILDSSGIAYQPIIDIIKKYHFNQMSAGYKIQAFSNIFIKAIENNDPDSLKPLITNGLLFNTSEYSINSGIQETRRHIYDISEFVPESSTFTSIAKTKEQSYRAFICDKIKRIENKNNRSLFASYLIASCANKALQIDTYKSLEINSDKLVETCYASGHIHLISKIYRVMLLVNKEETPLSVMRQAKPELKPYILSIMHD
ncbi:hypothetical protein L1267_23415, partial [Pseudoalteromonas sp. OFAV1]|uniref:hypothetical protein n=1 Tax=Pseudoalteromonas sp. OFAV1 TaxID=2908892 RepID=UPI001F3D6682